MFGIVHEPEAPNTQRVSRTTISCRADTLGPGQQQTLEFVVTATGVSLLVFGVEGWASLARVGRAGQTGPRRPQRRSAPHRGGPGRSGRPQGVQEGADDPVGDLLTVHRCGDGVGEQRERVGALGGADGVQDDVAQGCGVASDPVDQARFADPRSSHEHPAAFRHPGEPTRQPAPSR